MSRERKLCGVDGCGRPHVAHGMCQTHYNRVRIGMPTDRVFAPITYRKVTIPEEVTARLIKR